MTLPPVSPPSPLPPPTKGEIEGMAPVDVAAWIRTMAEAGWQDAARAWLPNTARDRRASDALILERAAGLLEGWSEMQLPVPEEPPPVLTKARRRVPSA